MWIRVPQFDIILMSCRYVKALISSNVIIVHNENRIFNRAVLLLLTDLIFINVDNVCWANVLLELIL